ncbi:penicillin-binding protein 2 [Thiomicrospira microaerophila]|uniref:penicillin-binding protein 2 n=1 Tax=Thiomicrospira microaerophila TaxID=406020 RepID=UPI0024B221B2|nr:penicillin-binding protein 2 [Thiomicrospira microaerophila]UQB41761.1 penicillin-binding protein 2 [Thiomicrospira microaerophila]
MIPLAFDETQTSLKQTRSFKFRILFVILVILIVFVGLIARMTYLQWFNHEKYLSQADGNRISVQTLPPQRGHIFDRNQVLLAGNVSNYKLNFRRENIIQFDATFEQLKTLFPEIETSLIDEFSETLRRTPRHRDLPLPYSLTEKQAATFAANRFRFPGITLQAQLKRTYPQNSSGVHFLGYVGRISQADLQRLEARRYRGSEVTGKIGIERAYEDRLHGYPGLQTVETNAQGRVVRILDTIPPKQGENITLTIDIRLQQFIEEKLGDRRGSVVAISPINGEVLALVSTPNYDPNLFVDGITHAEYNALLNNPNKPLINRALRGQYPPGSTTKPFVALGALEQGFTTTTERIFDPGYFEFQDHRYRNWRRQGHGWTDLKRSIVESVDTFYYKMSLDIGVDGLHSMLSPFGFGERTGIDIPGELGGILPSQEWKRRTHGEPWYRGETIIASIGQGYNLATPIQLAQATAILANRGRIIQPHLLKADRDSIQYVTDPEAEAETSDQIPIRSRNHWEYVIQGMIDSVHTPRGTAWNAGRHIKDYQIAGKTGTAQVFSLHDAEYNADELEQRLHSHSLFIAFAPASNPRIAVAIIVENAGGGGRVAAPIAIETIDYFLKELDQ